MHPMTDSDDATAFFWDVASEFLDDESVERSTMMGFPCLRVNKQFFASAEPKTGDLIVKLPAERVLSMIEAGEGHEFAPNGRRFKEWVRVAERDEARWKALMAGALQFVDGG